MAQPHLASHRTSAQQVQSRRLGVALAWKARGDCAILGLKWPSSELGLPATWDYLETPFCAHHAPAYNAHIQYACILQGAQCYQPPESF